MMNFEAQGENAFDNADLAQAGDQVAAPVAAGGARTILTPDGQGAVILPDGVSLEDIQVQGRDLVVVAADGTRYVIPDGAITVPQIEIDGVAVPPDNLAALLLGNEPVPAAGPPQSSGGNFADDVNSLQNAFGLGDLLPYTELQFPAGEEEEILQDFIERRPDPTDRLPDISIEPGGSGVSVVNAQDTVDEAGLPARGGESAGSNSAADSESTFGFINFSSPDGPSQVAINGVAVTQVGQTFSTPLGVLTITSIADGRIGYSYTLTDNTTNPAAEDLFTVTITDPDGDTATATLRISIVDDVPTAADDAAAQGAENAPVVVDAFANDTPGADSVNLVSGVSLVPGSLSGAGTVAYNGDGTFTYTPAPGEEGTVTFDYTITDGDGDTSTATVTITLLADSTPTVDVIMARGDAVVHEAGLPAGSDAAADSETTSGTLAITTGGDTLGSLVIGGVDVTGGGTVAGAFGTLTVSLSGGVYSYSYTLTTSTSGDSTKDTFTVVVTDSDGDSASAPLVIDIVDDVPTAADDAAAQGAENAPVVVDAFANDTPGADSVNLVSGVSLVPGSVSGAGTVAYNGDGTFTYTPAPGEEGTVTFDYTITDGDGDTSTATVTITLLADSTPTVDVITAQGGAVVHEAGLPAGSDAAADSETTSGTLAITTGGDTLGSLVIGGVDVTGGGTVAGAYGTLTISLSGGVYSYSYTLTTSTSGDSTKDTFTVVVTDSDGDSASAPLVIDIVDDVPTARADADSVSEDGPLVADGNVLTGSGGTDANMTDGVADTSGADGAVVTTTGTFAGQHGTFVLNADGSYTYTLNNGDTAVQGLSAGETLTEVFAYTIMDGDGDTSSATVTITINGTDDGVTITGLDATGGEEVVYEDDLADGSSPDAAALTQTGTFGFSSPDGLDDVSIGGTQVITNGVFTPGLTASSAHGTVTITGFTPVLGADGSIIGGTFSYSYTLDDNTLTHSAAGADSVTDSFAVTVTDTDGSSATASLDVRVVDDVPTAQADTNTVTEGGVVAGNVLANDELGADGAAPGGAVTGVAAGSDTSNAIAGGLGGAIAGAYGTLTLNANGSYTYTSTPNTVPPAGATDTFVYTITDGDGDTSTVTLTIDLSDSGLAATNEDAAVNEAALAIGSDPTSTAETTTGTLANNVSGGTGPYTFALVGGGAGSNGTLTLNADGSWSYTLATPVDGATADNGPNTVNNVETFTYEVTDAHGNTTTNTLTIDVIDDVPTARDDAAVQAAENAPIVIDALANDVFGADGVVTADPASVSVETQPAFGTVTYDPATGKFTYTPAAGAGSTSTTDSFTYTIVDADGDRSTATVTVTLLPDSQPVVSAVTAAVDDDALGGSALSTTGDIDANAGENPFSASEAVFNGKIDVDFGTDGGTVTLANLHGTAGQVGTEAVTYGWDESSRTLTATSARGPVFSVTLDADGAYTVTLLQNVLHAPGGDEASAPPVVLNYLATDGDDGDTATGTLTITFNDDAPFATDNAATVEEGGSTGGNVLTDGTPDQFGADGAATGGGVIGFAQGGTTAAAGGSIVTALGTLTLHADGTYTYVAKPNTVTADTTDIFTYTIEDGDGDVSTATLTINVSAVTGTVSDDNVLVNEAGLNGSGSVGVGSDAASDSETDANGAITATGGTPPYTYAITSSPGSPVGTLTLNPATGTYSYTLNGPIDGPTAADGAQTLTNVESYGYEVRDSNGNIIGTGTIVVDVIDDVPTARDDAAVVVPEDAAPVGGNLLANDTQGADGATVVSVNIGGVDYPVAAAGTTVVPLANGTYTFQPNGAWTFDPNTGLDQTGGPVDASFTYTIEDGDGDRSTAAQPISIVDGAGPSGGGVLSLEVDDDALANGTNPDKTDQIDSGAISFTAGSDALTGFTFDSDLSGLGGGLTWTLSPDGKTIEGHDGARLVVTLELIAPASIAAGATGQVTVKATLHGNYDSHPGAGLDDMLGLGSVGVIATDTDGTPATAQVDLSVSDDVPIAVNDGGSVVEGGSTSGNVLANDKAGADGFAASPTGPVTGIASLNMGTSDTTADGSGNFVLTGQWGQLTLNSDGSYTYESNADAITGAEQDVFTYTVVDADGDTSTATLTIDLSDVALIADNHTQTVYEAALDTAVTGADIAAGTVTGSNPGSTGETVTGALGVAGATTYTLIGGTAGTYGTIQLNADGTYTYTLTAPVDNQPHANDGNDVQAAGDVFTYQATDANGNTVQGTITIDIVDDVPTAVTAYSVNVTNGGGGSASAYLDTDNDVDNNMGADGGKVIFTAATIAALEAQSLTSGLAVLEYTISADGTVLTATKSTNGSVVFTIALQPAGSEDQYVVTMSQPLDSSSTIEFSEADYDFVGGNDPWAGFVPNGQNANKGGTPVNDDSQDLLITPFGAPGHSVGNAINGTANSVGVSGGAGGGGQNVGTNEGIRLDFVIDLTGNPAGSPANYDSNGYQRDHVFDNHYQVNGVSVRFGDGQTNTTISIRALDVSDVHDDVYQNGVLVSVSQIVISFDGENQVFSFDPANLTQTLSVGSPGGATDRNYTVTWVESSPGSGVYYVEVTGILDDAVRIATHGETSYEAIEILHLAGDDFELTGFGAVTVTNEPVDFTVPISVVDGDGDTVGSGNLSITANPATPPVALDLDGDGVEFLGLDAGVAHDYGSGLMGTAWVASDDGLLARDTGSGLDIVFTDDAPGATSDLEGVRLAYDSDGDGLLTANDSAWTSFGVWQDANSNGKVDAGEFTSLADAGIASIGLVSDGQTYNAAGGDVVVKGTATFTRTDGSTGDVADALFATGAQQKAEQRTAETVVTAAAAAALLAPEPVLAHDERTVADEPLERLDAELLEGNAQPTADNAEDADPSATGSLLGNARQAEPEAAERTADRPAEGAPPVPEAAPQAEYADNAPGAHSEPAADFGSSAFAGFQADASGGAIMDALLALQAAPAEAAASGNADPAVKEALGEVAQEAAVDAIVDHFAGGEGASAKWGGEIDPAVLLKALDGHVFAGNGPVIPDAMDDAALMAAAVQG